MPDHSSPESAHSRPGTGPAHVCHVLAARDRQAQAIGDAAYDGVVFEMEHGPYDIRSLRDCLQYMLNRRQIVAARQPGAGRDAVRAHPAQWRRAQPVDRQAGAGLGRVRRGLAAREHRRGRAQRGRRVPLSAAESRRRTSRRPARRRAGRRGALLGPDPAGVLRPRRRLAAGAGRRGPGGRSCAKRRAPSATCRDILREVPGIGVVLIGEGDLSQDLGFPRQYEHPTVAAAIAEILSICKKRASRAGTRTSTRATWSGCWTGLSLAHGVARAFL